MDHRLISAPEGHWIIAANAEVAFAQPAPSKTDDSLVPAPGPLQITRFTDGDGAPWIPLDVTLKENTIVTAVSPCDGGVALFFASVDTAHCIHVNLLSLAVTKFNPVFLLVDDDANPTNQGLITTYIAPVTDTVCIFSLDDGHNFAIISFLPEGWRAIPKKSYQALTDIPKCAVMSAALPLPDRHTPAGDTTVGIHFAYPTSRTEYVIAVVVLVVSPGVPARISHTSKQTIQAGEVEPIHKLHAFTHPAYKEPLLGIFYQNFVGIMSPYHSRFVAMVAIPAAVAAIQDIADPTTLNVVDAIGLITPITTPAPGDTQDTGQYEVNVRAMYKHAGTYTPFTGMSTSTLFQKPGFFILHPSPAHVAIFRDDYIAEPSGDPVKPFHTHSAECTH